MSIEITAQPVTGIGLVQRAASITAHGATCKAGTAYWARCEHSPLRAYLWWVELRGISYRTSVHLSRHHIGVVDHFISTTRPDRAPDGGSDSKSAPVEHGILLGAQALINIARKRLCYKSSAETVAAVRLLRRKVMEADVDLGRAMRPECVYRNGFCPEPKQCRPGIEAVRRIYEAD